MDPFVGTIMMWPSTRIPVGWVICDGRTLNVSGNEVLYSLIGTTYGGSGTTFKVPDMRGLVPVGAGQPAGATKNYIVGQPGGAATVALQQSEMPVHTHTPAVGTITMTNSGSGLQASKSNGSISVPTNTNNALAAGYCAQTDSGGDPIKVYNYGATSTPIALDNTINVAANGAIATVAANGNSMAHSNVQPTMGIVYLICSQGIYPEHP
jgi:microcystin-dependent protein